MADNIPHNFGGPWTLTKLDALKRYLIAFNIALKGQPKFSHNKFKRIYIDAFAGTGRCDIHFNGSIVSELGSASIALTVDPPFDKYFLFEKNPSFVKELDKLKIAHPDRDIVIQQGDANHLIINLLEEINWGDSRAVIFLDPYALELEWSVLEKISQTKAIDVWCLFPIGAVTRISANSLSKANKALLTKIFGTNDWEKVLYCQSHQASLLEDIDDDLFLRASSQTEILQYYKSRLMAIFPSVLEPIILSNNHGVSIFGLYFMSSNPKQTAINTSANIAKHLLKMHNYKRLKRTPEEVGMVNKNEDLFGG